jgi:hypothetical protein
MVVCFVEVVIRSEVDTVEVMQSHRRRLKLEIQRLI